VNKSDWCDFFQFALAYFVAAFAAGFLLALIGEISKWHLVDPRLNEILTEHERRMYEGGHK